MPFYAFKLYTDPADVWIGNDSLEETAVAIRVFVRLAKLMAARTLFVDLFPRLLVGVHNG